MLNIFQILRVFTLLVTTVFYSELQLCFVLTATQALVRGQSGKLSNDPTSPVINLAIGAGYPIETHIIVSRSNYLLTYHRIPRGKKQRPDFVSSNNTKYPVLLQHGIVQSSHDWVSIGEQHSLGFLLADLGYDVWLGNLRGNGFSNEHKTLPKNELKFWDFSFHEMADEDLPSVIDYILQKTSQPLIQYVGYSLGSTTLMTTMALHPDYNMKVATFIAMAPVVYVQYARSLLIKFGLLPGVVEYLKGLRHKFATVFDTEGFASKKAMQNYCAGDSASATICYLTLYAVFGENPEYKDYAHMMELFKERHPISFKMLIHFMQISKAKKFQGYDYGAVDNQVVYNSAYPRVYPLHKVTVPTALIWCENDFLSDPMDVATLSENLPNVIDNYRVPNNNCTHLGFLSVDAYEPVYKHVVALLERFADTRAYKKS